MLPPGAQKLEKDKSDREGVTWPQQLADASGAAAARSFLPIAFLGGLDLQVVESLTGLKGCNHPFWSFPSARPFLRWIQRIAVLGEDLWIFPPRHAIRQR